MNKFQNLSRRMLPVILVLLLVGLLFGCSGSKSFVGKYVSRNNLDQLELKSNGTCYLEEYGNDYGKGTYEVEGTSIRVEFAYGWDEGKIEGDTIIGISLWDADKTWVKKRG